MAMSNKENAFIYMQGVSQGREELEDKVEGLEDMLEISDSIANSSQNNEKLWRSKFFKADNRIKELENKIKFLQHHCRESGKAIEGLCSRAAELTEEKCNFCKCEKPTKRERNNA